jgi:hypothetical protein
MLQKRTIFFDSMDSNGQFFLYILRGFSTENIRESEVRSHDAAQHWSLIAVDTTVPFCESRSILYSDFKPVQEK